MNKTVWELFQFFQFFKKSPLKTNDNVYLKQGDFYLNYKNENNHDFLKNLWSLWKRAQNFLCGSASISLLRAKTGIEVFLSVGQP